jgi:pseudaminic acid biosynthesis-associated methylase
MSDNKTFATDQENFWAGEFGSEYIGRNASEQLLASNLNFFSSALKRAGKVSSVIEFGANIGMNLRAMRLLYPELKMCAVEINPDAASQLARSIGSDNVYCGSIFDYRIDKTFDLALIKGVLIHINPAMLEATYAKLYEASHRHILVCEYYNPSPVAIPYRGHADRLFKRDFAGEMLDKYTDLSLIDYGFSYRRDVAYPQDDITWFLLERKG